MECADFQRHASAWLYDELDDDELIAQLEEHRAGCDACRMTCEGVERTRQALDAWAPVEVSGEALDTAAAAIAHATRPGPVARLRPWAFGVAAALLLFVGLVALGASVTVENGRLAIGFGAETVSSDQAAARAAEIDAIVRTRVREAVNEDRTLTIEAIEGYLAEWEGFQNEQYAALVDAVRTARVSDRRAVEVVAIGAAEERRATRDVLDGVIQLIALDTRSSELGAPVIP